MCPLVECPAMSTSGIVCIIVALNIRCTIVYNFSIVFALLSIIIDNTNITHLLGRIGRFFAKQILDVFVFCSYTIE